MASENMVTCADGDDSLWVEAERAFAEGRYGDAEQLAKALLSLYPLNGTVLNLMGTILDRLERYQEASVYYSKAITLNSQDMVAQYNLANTVKRLGDTSQCEKLLRNVLAVVPEFCDARQNLAVCCAERGCLDEAIALYEQVVQSEPWRTGCWADLGELYHRTGSDPERALVCLTTALERIPGNGALLSATGDVLHELQRYREAEEYYRSALEHDPGDACVLNNLGTNFRAQGDPVAALDCFAKALEKEPSDPSVTFNRGITRLLLGDYKAGWEGYEARFHTVDSVYLPPLDMAVWGGEMLNGRTLLVRSEQGYGDCIQFARYLPLLSRYGGRVVFECIDASLAPIFQRISGIDQLLLRGDKIPAADFQIPLGSLPRIFGTDLTSIPFAHGYLSPDPERVAAILNREPRLARHDRSKVGLVWGGRKTRLNANRSISLDQCAPLFTLPGIRWFSLQQGPDLFQREHHPVLVDLGALCHDFADTAAATSKLDLVITIDTAMAHLAGALGIPAWVLLKKGADWRWMLDRTDSPWYASLRLFRQEKAGEWMPVISECYENLAAAAKIP